MIRLICLITLVAVTGCSPQLPAMPPAPTELVIQLTSDLHPLENVIRDCSLALQPMPVLVHELARSRMNLQGADISLSAVQPVDGSQPAYLLGMDHLQVIVHPDNPITSIPLETLQGMIQGFITRWDVIGSSQTGEIHLLAYPPTSEMQMVIESRLSDGQSFSVGATRIFIPEDILLTVASDPAAMGFIPFSLTTPAVRQLRVEGVTPATLEFAIIAQTRVAPDGNPARFLHCLQQSLNK